MKAEDLYGQISETGKPFNCGYYIETHLGAAYFAEGEEKERDEYLKINCIFDKDNTTWEELHENYEDGFYYSEWFVIDDMDGGYDEDGNYYDCIDGEFVKEIDLNDYKLCGGDGLEYEEWEHQETGEVISIDIIITRSFNGRIIN